MTTYKGPELIVTSNLGNFCSENSRFLFVGDENFVERSKSSPHSVSILANDGLVAIVKNWYGQHEHPLIAEVMDAGLRMWPETVIFNYDDIFLADHNTETLELILSYLSIALRTGHSVEVLYDGKLYPEAPEIVALALPEFKALTDR